MSNSDDASLLPPKREVALALVQTATSVFIHLDPRGEEVIVPSWFKNQPELVLQVGLNLVPPIMDLDIGSDALSATLSFNRRPEYCEIPWGAIWGLVGDDGRGMIWPESVPPEVAARAPGRATGASKGEGAGRAARKPTHLRAAGQATKESSSSDASEPSAEPRGKRRAPGESSEPASRADSTSDEGNAGRPTSDSNAPRKRELPSYLRVVK